MKIKNAKSLGCINVEKAARRKYIRLYSLAVESEDPCPGMNFECHINMRPEYLPDCHRFSLPRKCIKDGLCKTEQRKFLRYGMTMPYGLDHWV